MEENTQLAQNSREFKYKTDKVEKYLSFSTLVVLLFSFKSTIMSYLLYAIAIVVFVYYFVWYRKNKLPYIRAFENEIIILEGFFFKPCVIKKGEFKSAKNTGSRIQIEMNSGRKVYIYEILLSADDYKEILSVLKDLLK